MEGGGEHEHERGHERRAMSETGRQAARAHTNSAFHPFHDYDEHYEHGEHGEHGEHDGPYELPLSTLHEIYGEFLDLKV